MTYLQRGEAEVTPKPGSPGGPIGSALAPAPVADAMNAKSPLAVDRGVLDGAVAPVGAAVVVD
jgi:hypothetical protein